MAAGRRDHQPIGIPDELDNEIEATFWNLGPYTPGETLGILGASVVLTTVGCLALALLPYDWRFNILLFFPIAYGTAKWVMNRKRGHAQSWWHDLCHAIYIVRTGTSQWARPHGNELITNIVNGRRSPFFRGRGSLGPDQVRHVTLGVPIIVQYDPEQKKTAGRAVPVEEPLIQLAVMNRCYRKHAKPTPTDYANAIIYRDADGYVLACNYVEIVTPIGDDT